MIFLSGQIAKPNIKRKIMDLNWEYFKVRASKGLVLGNPLLTKCSSYFRKRKDYASYSTRMEEKISHTHRCIFIHIPKAAGSSIKNELYDSPYGGSHASAQEFRILFPKEYKSYYKFAIVRNPWDRLVSTYNYFLRGGNGSSLDRKVEQKLKSLKNFEGFCQYLNKSFSPKKKLLPILPHFLPQAFFVTDRYNKSIVDTVLRYENIQEDFESINKGAFEGIQLSKLRATKHDCYRSYYTEETKELIATVYSKDIQMFKYVF